MKSLVVARNQLASYLTKGQSLPPMIRNAHQCARCYQLENCLLFHRFTEDGTASTSGVPVAFEEVRIGNWGLLLPLRGATIPTSSST